jgi:hypothetical protein
MLQASHHDLDRGTGGEAGHPRHQALCSFEGAEIPRARSSYGRRPDSTSPAALLGGGWQAAFRLTQDFLRFRIGSPSLEFFTGSVAAFGPKRAFSALNILRGCMAIMAYSAESYATHLTASERIGMSDTDPEFFDDDGSDSDQ